MQPKTQIFIVDGGMTFKSQKDFINFLKNREISIKKTDWWTDEFLKQSLSQNFDIIKPRMPLQDNAKYTEWKIHFEKYIPYLQDNLILIGQSLGGIFLVKYLSENKFPKKILSTFLIAPPYDNTLPGEDLVGGFRLKSDLSLLEKSSENLYLMFSKDDETLPISHAKKFQKKLKSANFIIYESKNGHFRIPEFPEIVELIKRDAENL